VIDVSDIEAPRQIGSPLRPEAATEIFTHAAVSPPLFVATGFSHVYMYDASLTAQEGSPPRFLRRVESNVTGTSMALRDRTMVIAQAFGDRLHCWSYEDGLDDGVFGDALEFRLTPWGSLHRADMHNQVIWAAREGHMLAVTRDQQEPGLPRESFLWTLSLGPHCAIEQSETGPVPLGVVADTRGIRLTNGLLLRWGDDGFYLHSTPDLGHYIGLDTDTPVLGTATSGSRGAFAAGQSGLQLVRIITEDI